MKKSILTFFSFFLFVSLFSQTGTIDNIQVEQRNDGSELVDVYFDLNGTGDEYYIKIRVSFDAGSSYWAVNQTSLTGDTGPMSGGAGKHIVWDPAQQFSNRYSPVTKLKIMAYLQGNMNPCPGSPTVTDIDGNVYNTLLFGNQCWMAENLNTTRDASSNTIFRRCYDDNNEMCDFYGGLYSWETVMNGASSSNGNPSGVQGICPNGWHVPSDAEWTELTDYLMSNYADVNPGNIGDKLKSCRQIGSPVSSDCNTEVHPRWDSCGTHYGINDFGFGLLPGGFYGYYKGSYCDLGINGHWWSSTEGSATKVWIRKAVFDLGTLFRDYSIANKLQGFSVRCVRD